MSTLTEIQPMETIQMRLPLGSQPTPASPSAATRRNKIKLDPLRALEPARKKLTTIESQRVMCVLEETKKKCDIVGSLPHIMKNLEKISAMVEPQVAVCLADHKKIYDKFTNLELKHTDITLRLHNDENANVEEESAEASATPQQVPTPPASRPTSRGLSSRGSMKYRQPSDKEDGETSGNRHEELDSVIAQIKMVELELQISIKNIMRVMNLYPGVASLLTAEVGNSRSREGMFFTTQLEELRGILMEKLLMTPIEEKEKMHYLSQVIIKIEKAIVQKFEIYWISTIRMSLYQKSSLNKTCDVAPIQVFDHT